MIILRLTCALAAAGALITTSLAQAPRSPWPPGDELGMANTLGPATWQRCATYLADPRAKSYELSYLRSNTMPQSPFGTPLVDKYRPTVGIPGTRHAFNGEEAVSGEAGAQGTKAGSKFPSSAPQKRSCRHAKHRAPARRSTSPDCPLHSPLSLKAVTYFTSRL